jgi:hypothetical protein
VAINANSYYHEERLGNLVVETGVKDAWGTAHGRRMDELSGPPTFLSNAEKYSPFYDKGARSGWNADGHKPAGKCSPVFIKLYGLKGNH